MIPIVAALLQSGLSLIGNAVLAKGKNIVEDKLGVDLDKSMGSEEGRIKLAQLQAEHEADLLEFTIKKRDQELKSDEMAYADTDSARKMQTAALSQDDVFSKRFVYYFASAWSFVAATYIGFITFAIIPAANVRFADTILGFILGTVIATIINFFFGSSKSSHNKDSALAEAIKGTK